MQIAEFYTRPQETLSSTEMETRYKDALSLLCQQANPSLTDIRADITEVLLLRDGLNQPELPSQYKKYIGDLAMDSRLGQERLAQFRHLSEGLLNRQICALSYGVFAPSYRQMLREQRDQLQGPTSRHRALLVGALSPQTVMEFSSSVRQVFPDAGCAVVDIEGIETEQTARKIGDEFFRHNILTATPEALDGLYHSIHTNNLLQQLKRPSLSPRYWNPRNQFLSQTGRLLIPGGRLIMVEGYGGNIEKYARDLKKDLDGNGFVNVSIGVAGNFMLRRSVDKFFWTAGQDWTGANIMYDRRFLQITAEKKD